ncbi:MAG: hypothetical protein H7Y18_09320 [Clostridiaceae bacterium]|nr:hypothetical protein [Clostridiaceae bacterium]
MIKKIAIFIILLCAIMSSLFGCAETTHYLKNDQVKDLCNYIETNNNDVSKVNAFTSSSFQFSILVTLKNDISHETREQIFFKIREYLISDNFLANAKEEADTLSFRDYIVEFKSPSTKYRVSYTLSDSSDEKEMKNWHFVDFQSGKEEIKSYEK